MADAASRHIKPASHCIQVVYPRSRPRFRRGWRKDRVQQLQLPFPGRQNDDYQTFQALSSLQRGDFIGAPVVAPGAAAAVTLGETVAYLGRDATFHPLAAVDQGPVDLKVQILGAARPLWSVLIADEQFQPGTSAQQPTALVLIDRGTRYLVRREFGALPATPDTDKRETGLTRWIFDPALGRVAALSKVTTAPAYGADRFAILEVA